MTKKKLIKNQTIVLDYVELSNTRFEGCKMIYKGGRPPSLDSNDFINCEWIFENEAANTVAFIKGLVHGGGKDLILVTLGLEAND